MNTEQRLMAAITDCRIYQTRILLQLGARAEFVDEYGYSPLLRACQIDDKKQRTRTILIKLLIEYGADVNTTDPEGHHALAYSCIHSKDDIVSLVLETSLHDIDLNQQDVEGNTALIHAVRNGNIYIVKLLVDCMNKFHIHMHTRNNVDRTPYLEAVRLGMAECAKVLLEEGHASTNVQVNPFLVDHRSSKATTTKKQYYDKGWERIKAGRQHRVSNDIYHREIKAVKLTQQNITPSEHKKLLKRKHDSFQVFKKKATETKEQPLLEVLEEVSCDQNIGVAVDLTRTHLINSCLATDKKTLEEDVANEKPIIRPRPHSAFVRKNLECDVPSRIFLTDATPIPSQLIPRHHRSKTAPAHRRPPSIKTQSSDASWHSHFTVRNSPTVNSLTRIMNLYGEQCSPESSYRKGVKPRKTDDSNVHAPVIVEHDPDKRSDGRRSSSGSVRSISGVGRNKFSSLTRAVALSIASKKAFTATKLKN